MKRKLWMLALLLIALLGTDSLFAATMRNLTSQQIVTEMKVGWNLGNTLDAIGGETAWGNPVTTKAMIDMVKAMGFGTVRIPVTWQGHLGAAPDYTIDAAWLNRVETVVNYVLDNGMYAIINSHHDEWVIPTTANQAAVTAQLTILWQQIATRFRDYSDYLIFETLNEPRVRGSDTEWTGGTDEYRTVINAYNLAAVNAIRGTGGNNTTRHLMIPTHAACTVPAAMNALVIPNNDSRIIVSLHTYFPYFFTMENGATKTWGSSQDWLELTNEMNSIYNTFVSKGRAVVIGEWGSINKDNETERIRHAEVYANAAHARKITCIWWDNGNALPAGNDTWALLNRNALSWYFPNIAAAVVRGATSDPIPEPTVDCSGVTAWSATAIYDTAGIKVTYNGKLYQNNWYSTGENPGTNYGANKVWQYIGPCSGAATPSRTATPTPTATRTQTSNTVCGDVNGDRSITIVDALMIAQYSVGLSPSGFNSGRADVNSDGSITIVDALMVAQFYVGLITSLNC